MGKPDGDLDERDWLKAELADLVDEDIQLATQGRRSRQKQIGPSDNRKWMEDKRGCLLSILIGL